MWSLKPELQCALRGHRVGGLRVWGLQGSGFRELVVSFFE